jgi:hypothetical protein
MSQAWRETAQDPVDGRDRDLEKAIQVLHGQP